MKLLAYHISWGTYGTRLHGDPRGTVDRSHNEYGTPVLGYDEHRWEAEKANLKFPPVRLDRTKMIVVEELVPQICERGHWTHPTSAAGPDHVHTMLASTFAPETIRRLLKRWLGQALNERFPGFIPEGGTCWAECCSTSAAACAGSSTTRTTTTPTTTPSDSAPPLPPQDPGDAANV